MGSLKPSSISVIDVGTGNARAIVNAYRQIGIEVGVASKSLDVQRSKALILPGVGSFGSAVQKLQQSGVWIPLQHSISEKIPVLGICLGMQLLSTSSEESEDFLGLGVMESRSLKFSEKKVRVPHVGWDTVVIQKKTQLVDGIESEFAAYFSHSYYIPRNERFSIATSQYDVTFTSILQSGNLYGIQFHPERSQKVGLKLLENFYKVVEIVI